MCGGEDGIVCIVGDVSQQGQPRQQMEGYSRTTRNIGKIRSEIIAITDLNKRATSICEMFVVLYSLKW